jgi:sugar phosphate isomerase/epimerase
MGQLPQSIAWWCFEASEITIEQLVRIAADIGYRGIELVDKDNPGF